jgi:hypothetical protein
MTEQATGLALLRVPFPAHQISKLPKPTKQQTEEVKADYKKGTRCTVCGTWHHPQAVHLDYVGHAALTDRLLNADPMWSWEPLSMSESGLPVFDGFGGMWIKLTVCGVTRLGYGHAGQKDGGDAIKEVIGDALRNAAMRFGAALDLWHKGDLHAEPASLEPILEASIEQAKQKKAGVMGAVLNDIKLSAGVELSLSKLADRITPDAKGFDLVEEQGLTNDEKTYLWSLLDSKVRSALKREGQTRALMQAHTTA